MTVYLLGGLLLSYLLTAAVAARVARHYAAMAERRASERRLRDEHRIAGAAAAECTRLRDLLTAANKRLDSAEADCHKLQRDLDDAVEAYDARGLELADCRRQLVAIAAAMRAAD